MSRPAVDDDLYFEILKSERVRVRVLMVVMAALLCVAVLVALLPGEWVPLARLVEGTIPFGRMAAFWAVAFAYELGVHTVLGAVIARRRRIPELPRYANAALETSIPTVLMILLSGAIGPAVALNSPLPLVYFVFIALSTLRLSAPLSIFTGCVAGLQYAVLAFYFLGGADGTGTYVTSPGPIVGKALVLVVTGLVCGFVGSQLRHRLVASLQLLTDRNRVIGMFGQYVSPAVVDRLLTTPVTASWPASARPSPTAVTPRTPSAPPSRSTPSHASAPTARSRPPASASASTPAPP